MSETRRTLLWAGVALVLLLTALASAPRRVTPEVFLDQGQPFFPQFTDPNAATTLEVIDFDETTSSPRPFKVTFEGGRWVIPSHYNYPADAKDRLAKTAAGIIELRKDEFRTRNVADQEACGVIDPLDESAGTLSGRGKRVTIKGTGGKVLADLILGKKVEGREKLYFVRVPGQNRVYVSHVDMDLSTRFQDWIDRDLLQVKREEINEVTLKDYSINEMTGRINQRDTLVLTRQGKQWKANRMSSRQEVDAARMTDLLKAIDELSIVGVRPKPRGLSDSLKRPRGIRISRADVLSLQSKGYYFTRGGTLVSNEGELEVGTSAGVVYTLRFGEVVSGRGAAATAGSGKKAGAKEGPAENRYLFITTRFDPSRLPEPPRPRNRDFEKKEQAQWSKADKRNRELARRHEEWEKKMEEGRRQVESLNQRFAGWYYVISSASFDKIHQKRSTLLKGKSAPGRKT